MSQMSANWNKFNEGELVPIEINDYPWLIFIFSLTIDSIHKRIGYESVCFHFFTIFTYLGIWCSTCALSNYKLLALRDIIQSCYLIMRFMSLCVVWFSVAFSDHRLVFVIPAIYTSLMQMEFDWNVQNALADRLFFSRYYWLDGEDFISNDPPVSRSGKQKINQRNAYWNPRS